MYSPFPPFPLPLTCTEYAHPGEKARRHDPRKYHYSGTACPDFRKGHCKKGDACEFAHGVFKCWLHPAQSCKDGTSCKRRPQQREEDVGAVVGVVTPTDSNVGVGGVVTPNGTANHELAAQVLPSQPLLKLRIAALIIKAAHQFMEAKGSFIQAREGVAMPSESEPSESASDREGLVDEQRHVKRDLVDKQRHVKRGSDEVNPSDSVLPPSGPHANTDLATPNGQVEISVGDQHGESTVSTPSVGDLHGESTVSTPRVTPLQWIFILNSIGLEILSAVFDQVSSPRKPLCALISLLIAIVGVIICIWELIHGRMKEKDEDASSNSMVYRSLPDIFGLGLAVIQCVWSAVQYYYHHQHTSNPMRLSPVALYFYVCLVVLKYYWRGRPYGI